jgi:hypothetical protein
MFRPASGGFRREERSAIIDNFLAARLSLKSEPADATT